MDIQKERKAFELNIGTVIWGRIEYNAENNIYMAKSKYLASNIVQAVANEIDFGWKMWQAAKAQAVPEEFILVPKEPTFKQIDALKNSCEVLRKTGLSDLEANGAYKAMIEAQEQTQ